tara:strand:- start:874 stop:1668 length:795 start_codon:yes stop_codon:yes gene_type:complete
MSRKLLILGGTFEAYRLVDLLISNFSEEKLIVVSSLSGATTNPKITSGEFRIGGFGGFSGLKNYLKNNNISILINATHPFANKISANAFTISKELGIPYFRLSRPAWKKISGDKWIDVPDVKTAADQLIKKGNSLPVDIYNRNIFLSIGSRELHYFKKCHSYNFFIRTIEKPKGIDTPIKSNFLHDRGPFILKDEINLFKKYSIKLLISKNSGGEQTYSKIEASRKLKIPIIMVKRPKISSTNVSHSVNEAINWISKLLKKTKN